MPNYSYSCSVCNAIVKQGIDVCSNCGCPAITTLKELKWLKESWGKSAIKTPIDNHKNPYLSHKYSKRELWKLAGYYLLTTIIIYSTSFLLLAGIYSPHAFIGNETAINILNIILIAILITPALLTYRLSKKIKA